MTAAGSAAAMQSLNWVTQGSVLAAPQVWIDAVLETTQCVRTLKTPTNNPLDTWHRERTLIGNFRAASGSILGSVPSVQLLFRAGSVAGWYVVCLSWWYPSTKTSFLK